MPPRRAPVGGTAEREGRIQSALSLLSTTLTQPAAAAAAASDGDGDHEAALRRCRPWSREDLLERARTFRIGLWMAPPPGLRPLECARHGWHAVAPQTLACACSARLVFPRDQADGGAAAAGDEGGAAAAAAERAMVKHLLHSLRAAHKPECPWRDAACPAAFLGYPPLDTGTVIAELKRRAESHRAVTCAPPLHFAAGGNTDCAWRAQGWPAAARAAVPRPRHFRGPAVIPTTCHRAKTQLFDT